jgi:hypothetical protein
MELFPVDCQLSWKPAKIDKKAKKPKAQSASEEPRLVQEEVKVPIEPEVTK